MQITVALANWIADIRMGSARGAKRSQQRMWPLNSTAQTHTSASPRVRLNVSVTHSRYMPITPSATASHTSRPLRCLNRIAARIGTSSMYMAVMNPAFPAVVVTMPIC